MPGPQSSLSVPANTFAGKDGRLVRSAVFDESGAYRYLLERRWARQGPTTVFIMLNPSRADAQVDDPTIRRCMGFARDWHSGRLLVANLFALCTHNPALLKRAASSEGPLNDEHLRLAATSADRIVLAWGIHGGHLNRDQQVLQLLGSVTSQPLECLGRTKAGQPRHVLYLPRASRLEPFLPR